MKLLHVIPVILAGAVLPVSLSAQKSKQKKPNIIFILADDLGYGDLSCYGQKYFTTPNLDELAAQGIKFTSHYAGCTVSAPSRASLMTGLHTGHTPIRGNKEEKSPLGSFDSSLPSNYKTVAEYLKGAGYSTACVGKWGLGGPGTQGSPVRHGFDYFYGHIKQLDAHFHFPEYLWENEEKVMLNKQFYAQDLFLEKASDFIKSNKDKPFFLYFAVTIPHAELSLADKYQEPFRDKYHEKPYEGNGHYCAQEYAHGTFAGMIHKLDSDVGAIRKLLETLEIDENTLIIFSSDNGPHIEGGADPSFFNSGGGLRGVKRDVYEGGIRVPMIAYWPSTVKAGTVTDHPSAFWDVLPTFCEIAGVKVTQPTDGLSFLPLLKGEKTQVHDSFYWEFHENGGSQAVRIGDWKGIRLKIFENINVPMELYNLNTDMAETTNVADQHPDIVAKMRKVMDESHKEDSNWPFYSKSKIK